VLREESKRKGISFKVSTCEALVGAVECREVVLSLDNVQDLLPLGIIWITTCWIMSANMENDNGLVICFIEVLKHSVQVEALALSIIIPVSLYFKSSLFSNIFMCWPCWIWDVNLGIFLWIPCLQEFHADSERTGSRDRLTANGSVGFDDFAVCSISQLEAFLSVRRYTVDARVLVIHLVPNNFFFGLLDAIKNKWFSLVISVSSHAQENFFWVSVLLEGVVQSKDWISWCGIH